ncbi:uncharacterized protein LOC110974850 [Acanthaster planci]|uniref:Pseudouridylate synthase RPUSD2 n=1 Tax=Acanthaster planci TaxID=133434 RepID=A0A8B7XR27_ACAPL|nr:uncharacterized protein LOC110974850 [Acanthaster planci]
MIRNQFTHMRLTARIFTRESLRSCNTFFNPLSWTRVLSEGFAAADMAEPAEVGVRRMSDTTEAKSPLSPVDESHGPGADCKTESVLAQTVQEAKTDGLRLKRKEFSGKTKKGKKLDRHPKKIQKFSNDQKFDETTYYYENGLRKVTPYVYVFETHIKGRWMGCSLLDVFKREFRMETPEYYKKAISRGLITINGQKVSTDKILHNNEFLRSMVHRHEPPVTGEPLDIIAVNDEFVVINKPASVPVHPCGKYRHNTIIFMLGKEHRLTGLHTIHRLDRLTSGLLMFARTREVSQRVDAYVRDRKLTKVYVCKVSGEFPSEPLDCSEPIVTVSHKIGVCRVSPEGKESKTTFQRLSYDGFTSIVQCTPHTGRMHQIRVHLQYLGYPIVNDPLYNNPVWGSQLGKGGDIPHTDEDLLTELIKQHTAELKSQVIEDPEMFIKTTRDQLVHDADAEVEYGGSGQGEAPNVTSAACSNGVEATRANDSTGHSLDEQGTARSDEHHRRNESTNQQTIIESCDLGNQCTADSEVAHPCGTGSSDQAGSSHGTCEDLPESSGRGKEEEEGLKELEEDLTEEQRHRLVQSLCRECRMRLRDPTPDEMTMYLHALSYKGPGFEFSTPLPKWAEEHIQRSKVMEESLNCGWNVSIDFPCHTQLLTELIKQHTAELKSQVIEDPEMFIKTTRDQLVQDADAEVEYGGSGQGEAPNVTSAACSNGVEATRANDSTGHSLDEQGTARSDEHHRRNESTNQQTIIESCDLGNQCTADSEVAHPCGTGSSDQAGSSHGTCEDLPESSGRGKEEEEGLKELEEDLTEEQRHRLVQSLCRECRMRLRDPTPDEMTMYLHALSYKGPGFEFSTPLPKWAEEHIQRSKVMEESLN